MKATFLDLRKKSRDIVRALDQNQSVTLFYRGKEKGVIVPVSKPSEKRIPVIRHRAFGMWRDRADMRDVRRAVARLRKARHAL
ncbi:MAG: hypothetical protein QHH14_03930 [Clostridiales bacterium]|nr:hypothetical protein [Clostridiales bacterium]